MGAVREEPALSAAAAGSAGPYVGPRAFPPGETLYGRDSEVVELSALLVAKRIVLLYSPSGAGKTSLIQAALIPALREKGFRVRPVIRVSIDPSAVVGEHPDRANRYVLSTIFSLERRRADETSDVPDELFGLDLETYLKQRPAEGDPADPEVLIFDQFEEILTTDPTDQPAKREFFTQLGRALRDRQRWALFSMREDFIAGLDPYLPFIPTRLVTTFRLDLLGQKAARPAIEQPAQRFGVAFSDVAVDRLVDDLRRVQVQRPDGETDWQPGPYVEPVQLQVVCLRLWQNRDPNATEIGLAELEQSGDVDSALGGYYADQVQAIASKRSVPERRIREWVEEYLITPQRMRGQVLQGPGATQGLENGVIRGLEDSYLVRGDRRRGVTWYELSHDRFIGPILDNNATWLATNLSPLQAQARLWERQDRPDDLLLRGPDLLDEAEQWATEHESRLEPFERDFLRESRAAQIAAEQERRRIRLIKILAVAATFVCVLAVGALAMALDFSVQARENAELALARQLVAQSFNHRDEIDLAMLLSVEALRVKDTTDTRGSLLTSVEYNPRLGAFLHGHTTEVLGVAFSPNGRELASCGLDGTLIFWDINSGQQVARPAGCTQGLAFSPDGRTVVSGTPDGSLLIWDVERRESNGPPVKGHDAAVTGIAFSPNGTLLASGARDGAVRLWDVEGGQLVGSALGVQRSDRAGEVSSVAFSADGGFLASGGADTTIALWDLATRQQVGRLDAGTFVRGLAFSPDGKTLAAGGGGGAIKLWNVASRERAGPEIRAHSESMLDLAFSPDGRLLATSGNDHKILLWDFRPGEKAGEPAGEPLAGHTSAVWGVAFSPDGAHLASAGSDGAVILWDLEGRHRLEQPLGTHGDRVTSVAFSRDGKQVASASADQTVVLRDIAAGLGRVLTGHLAAVQAIAFSPDGRTLVSGGRVDDPLILWDLETLQPRAHVPTDQQEITSVAFSPDGRFVAASSCTGLLQGVCVQSAVRLLDTAQPDQLANLEIGEPGSGVVRNVVFSPDSKLLAASFRFAVFFWDVERRQMTGAPLQDSRVGIESSAFSPDGKLLATGRSDGRLAFWDLDRRQLIGQPIRANGGSVRSVAFSRDGRMLVSSSTDGAISLWDASAAQRLGPALRGHLGPVSSVAFSPRGDTVVSGGDDGQVILWNVDFPGMKMLACKVAGRNLTRDEWRRYLGDRPYQKTCPDLPGG